MGDGCCTEAAIELTCHLQNLSVKMMTRTHPARGGAMTSGCLVFKQSRRQFTRVACWFVYSDDENFGVYFSAGHRRPSTHAMGESPGARPWVYRPQKHGLCYVSTYRSQPSHGFGTSKRPCNEAGEPYDAGRGMMNVQNRVMQRATCLADCHACTYDPFIEKWM